MYTNLCLVQKITEEFETSFQADMESPVASSSQNALKLHQKVLVIQELQWQIIDEHLV